MAGGLALSASLGVRAQEVDVDSFISTERPIALQGALNNIGPDGSEASGAIAGLVVASPSKANPDCEFSSFMQYRNSRANIEWTAADFYTWTRDSALTLKMIVDEYIHGNDDLQHYVEEYLGAQAALQTVTNPSGTFLPDGSGLGEPKYMVDGTRFNLAVCAVPFFLLFLPRHEFFGHPRYPELPEAGQIRGGYRG